MVYEISPNSVRCETPHFRGILQRKGAERTRTAVALLTPDPKGSGR